MGKYVQMVLASAVLFAASASAEAGFPVIVRSGGSVDVSGNATIFVFDLGSSAEKYLEIRGSSGPDRIQVVDFGGRAAGTLAVFGRGGPDEISITSVGGAGFLGMDGESGADVLNFVFLFSSAQGYGYTGPGDVGPTALKLFSPKATVTEVYTE